MATIPARGKILGTALTGSYATLLAAPTEQGHRPKVLVILNSCDQPIILSWDASTAHLELDTGEDIAIDCRANGVVLEQTLSVKHAGAAPTQGSVRTFCIQE